MNGFRKNKGIIIELTSLLDVIMIMLFWVMLNVSQTGESIKSDASQQIADASSQAEQLESDNSKLESDNSQLESAVDELNKQIEELQQNSTSSDETSQKLEQMQTALDGFENGMMISVELKNKDGEDRLYVSQNGGTQTTIPLSDTLEENLFSALNSYGLDEGTVVLAAFVYDGSKVLYRDMTTVSNALENIKNDNKNIYYTYINTGKE